MKTFYLTRPRPRRLVISSLKNSEIERAVAVATQVVELYPKWHTFIDLSVNNRPLGNTTDELSIRVQAFNDKGIVSSSVDIGKEGHEGWESSMDLVNDYQQLPEVWFSWDFIDSALQARKRGIRRARVLEEDKTRLLDQFIAGRDKDVEYNSSRHYERMMRTIAFDKGVLSLAGAVKNGELPYSVLQEVWPGRHKTSGKERET